MKKVMLAAKTKKHNIVRFTMDLVWGDLDCAITCGQRMALYYSNGLVHNLVSAHVTNK